LAPVRCNTTSADNLQVSHFAEISQNIVLNTVGKIRWRVIVPQAFEGQDGNAFGVIRGWCAASLCGPVRRLTSILRRLKPEGEQNCGKNDQDRRARHETRSISFEQTFCAIAKSRMPRYNRLSCEMVANISCEICDAGITHLGVFAHREE